MPGKQPTVSTDSVAQDQIRAFVDRVERLHEERTAIGKDISEVFAEAKGNGFDVKALKIVIAKRRQDHAERMELEALVEMYEAALGMRGTYDDEGREVGTIRATRAPAHEPASAANPAGEGVASTLPADTHPEAKATTGNAANSSASAEREPEDKDSEGTAGRVSQVGGAEPRASAATSEQMDATAGETAPNSEPGNGQHGGKPGSAGAPAADDASSDVSSVVPFPKPHDGPVSSTGLPRHKDCLKVDSCAGTWREACWTCRKAAEQQLAVEAGGVQVPHHGDVA